MNDFDKIESTDRLKTGVDKLKTENIQKVVNTCDI